MIYTQVSRRRNTIAKIYSERTSTFDDFKPAINHGCQDNSHLDITSSSLFHLVSTIVGNLGMKLFHITAPSLLHLVSIVVISYESSSIYGSISKFEDLSEFEYPNEKMRILYPNLSILPDPGPIFPNTSLTHTYAPKRTDGPFPPRFHPELNIAVVV